MVLTSSTHLAILAPSNLSLVLNLGLVKHYLNWTAMEQCSFTSSITGMQSTTYVHVDRSGLEFFFQQFIFHLLKALFLPKDSPLPPLL